MENARKWLIFGCGIGQRGQDLLNITKENFITYDDELFIELQQEKTGKNVTIPVFNDVEEIYKKGLPYKISAQKLNNYLKKICKLANIDEVVEGVKQQMIDENGNVIPKKNGKYIKKGEKRSIKGKYRKYELITTHTCRRTFATLYYGKIETILIMQITKHSTEKMLLEYIGKSPLDYAKDFKNKVKEMGL